MLNGVDPLLIITFTNKGVVDFLGPNSLLGGLVDSIGVPIPIYLSETLTGIYVDSETRGIDVDTKVDASSEKDPTTLEVVDPEVSQTSVGSQLTVSLLATEDAILLTALIALMEMIVKRLQTQEYSITYINGSSVIFGALLHRFGTSKSKADTLTRIEITLSTASKKEPTPKPGTPAVPKNATTSLSTPPSGG